MRAVVAMAVVLATVGTALTGVRQQSETRGLEYRVWDAMRRRDALVKQIRELETEIEEILAPRRLLAERDRRRAPAVLPASVLLAGDVADAASAAEGEDP